MADLVEKYKACRDEMGHLDDPGQEVVVTGLSELAGRLEADAPSLPVRLWRLFRPAVVSRGIYIYGDVGRGKTWLLDMFYDHLPLLKKKRMHFHEFMLEIHDQLQQLRGIKNPLRQVAENIARDTRVLCLDEFHVTDIADAMLMAGLLEELFRKGVVLVATSNTPIRDLYRDGLQRDRFMPAIGLLQKFTREILLDSHVDYRLARDDRYQAWCLVSDNDADAFLRRQFDRLVRNSGQSPLHQLLVNGRAIPVRGVMDGVAWFRFSDICGGFTSTVDYVDIARNFVGVIIEAVPVMDEGRDNEARRFINLVDALYDHNVRLRFTAEAAPAHLYTGRRLARAFARTSSRLMEMGKPQYLDRKGMEDREENRGDGGRHENDATKRAG